MTEEGTSMTVTPHQLLSWGIRLEDSQDDLSEMIPDAPEMTETQSQEQDSSTSVIAVNVIIPESELTPSFVDNVEVIYDNDNVNTGNSSTSLTATADPPIYHEDTSVNLDVNTATEKSTPVKSASNHHTGPYRIRYIEDAKARNKTFGKRKKTLLKNAEDLHLLTGAKVSLKIVTRSNTVFKYESDQNQFLDAQVQTEPIRNIAPLTPLKRKQSTTSRHTPKKVIRVTPVTQEENTPPLNVVNLPGKRTIQKTPATTDVEKKRWPCKECGIRYGSAEDDMFRKGKLRKTTWIGCERARCQYWAHASCAGLTLKPNITIEAHTFFCLKHRKR